MRPCKLLSVLLAVAIAFTLLTGAIAAPILCRPFYYAHIGPLELEARTGLTREEIRTAYDEMLDYCLGGEKFSTGVLKWSQSGKDHFTDVRVLFLLDLRVFAAGAAAIVILLIIGRLRRRSPARLLGRGPCFWAGAGLGGAFLIVGGLAALDFDRAFTVFHTIFFPGKTNWLFDPNTDQIINILPEKFFMDCAILILAVLVIGCAALILADFLTGRNRRT